LDQLAPVARGPTRRFWRRRRVLIVAAAAYFGYLWKLRDIEQLQRVRSYVNLRMT
jgi:hypothetical protein